MKVQICVIALATMGMLMLARGAQAQGRDPGGTATISATATATVKAIDPQKRMVTLETPDGKQLEVQCDKKVVNFDQIKVGDQVKAVTMTRLAVAVGKSGGGDDTGALIARSPKGSKPGVIVAKTEEVTAKVASVDTKARSVTLQGAEGAAQTVQVADDVDLSRVKEGDEVTFRVTKGVALWVDRPSDAKPAPVVVRSEGQLAGFALEGTSATSTVTAIDHEKRMVTLKSSDGSRSVHLGKEYINFDQIDVGDHVRATLADEVAISVAKAGASPGTESGRLVTLAPEGAKPGMLIVDCVESTGKIESIDAAKRTIKLSDANGGSHTFKAGPKVNLSELKTGDTVTARVTQAMAIVVEKP